MSQLHQDTISRISVLQNQIWQTVSLTVGEASGKPITFGSPLTISALTSDLYADMSSAMLVVQFAFAHQPDVAQVFLMPSDSFLAFSSLVKDESVEEIDENLLADIRPSIEAIVQGICMAIGDIRNDAMVASGLSIRYQVFSFPPNLQRQDELIRTQVAISGGDKHGTGVWLLDPETASLILGLDVQKSESDESNQAGFLSVEGGGRSSATNSHDESTSIDMLMDIPLEITVELGRLRMLIKDVVDLGTGSIVEIDKAAGEPVDVMVNGRLVAKGEVVVIEDNFGVRITEILTPHERLQKLSEVA